MQHLNTVESCELQHRLLDEWLQGYAQRHVSWPTIAALAANDERIRLSA
jgi:hypothetical protein